MAAIAARGHLPLVTGGTGLYLRALTMGLFAGPRRQQHLRARLTRSGQRLGPNWLHRLLNRLDPTAALRIHPNDIPKLIRAIEVSLTAGKSMSAVLSEGRDALTGFRLLRIGLNPPRPMLYDRLNQRAAEMFRAGLIEETRALLDRFGPVKSLDSLGYRQAASVLSGELSLPQAIAAAQQGHRNYAKRQLTWFRREPDVVWIEDFGDSEVALVAASTLLEHALKHHAQDARQSLQD
jgi:tRNA dimethylallyltransferase